MGRTTPPPDFEPGAIDIGRPPLPPGRAIDLPGRGRTFVREIAGPAGAPTVFLLHGWTVTAALNWFRVYEPLRHHVRVVSLDHRGHGRGIRARRRFRLEDAADDVAALADALGIDEFVVAGYSMGGPIGQLTWHRHRDRVSGMVLCATFARTSRHPMQRAVLQGVGSAGRTTRLLPRRHQMDLMSRGMVAAGGSAPSDRPPWFVAEVRSGSVPMMLEAGGAIARFDSTPWLGEFDGPAGVFITQLDGIVPAGRQHHLASLLPHAELRHAPIDHDGCVTRPKDFVGPFVELVRHAAQVGR